MREINFCGKAIDGNKWVYGYYVRGCTDAYGGTFDVGIKPPMCFPIEVDPSTVGQYTGLNDKSDKEVYGFHIVNVTNKGIYNGPKVVVWDDKLLCHVLVWADQFKEWKGTQHGTTYLKVSSGIKCEIIGNVFDNPELLTTPQGE